MSLLWIATWAALQAPPPQETPVPEPAKLFEELQKKFDAFGPFSGTFALEAVDAQGEKAARYKGSFHVRVAEEWLYLETQDLTKDKGHMFAVFEGNRPSQYWMPGEPGTRVHMNESLQEGWKQQWRFAVKLHEVLGGAKPAKDADAHVAALRPTVMLQMELSKPGAPEPVNFRFALGKSPKGGVTWLKVPAGDSEIAATSEEVIVREKSPAKTTKIDLKTGVLRSMRIDLPAGESRVLTLAGVESKPAKPELPMPERWTDRPARLGDAIAMVAFFLKGEAAGCLDNLLKEWAKIGTDDRAEQLRSFFAWIGAEMDALNRESARLQWAAAIIKQVLDQGPSIDEVRRDLDAQAKQLGERLRDIEGKSKSSAVFVERLIAFRTELEKTVEKAPGTDEAKKVLVARIREGFEPDRLRKAETSRPEPDYARILRETLDVLQEKESK